MEQIKHNTTVENNAKRHISLKDMVIFVKAQRLPCGSIAVNPSSNALVKKLLYLITFLSVSAICYAQTDNESGIKPGKYEINGHEYVDLGLSVKWATCNIGASIPSDYGDYFAWGETKPKSEYNWSTLKYCLDSEGEKFSKYVTDKEYGSVDGKSVLDMTDDVARVNWGGKWRMPTRSEQKELKDKCTWTWTTLDGHEGYNVTSMINGNSIFFPAAGYRYYDSLDHVGSEGSYWSSSLNTDCPYYAYYLYFNSVSVETYGYGRYDGIPVRPVLD